MSLLTREDKAKIKAQIKESERLVKEEAEQTNKKLNKLIKKQAAHQRGLANEIENTHQIKEAVRLLEINKKAYLESMNSLESYITGLKKETNVNFEEIHRVIETNKYVTQLVSNRQIDYIKELGPKTPAFATALYDRYMDARQKIFEFATISIEEDESLLKALAGIQSDSDSRSSRSSSRSRSRSRGRSSGRSSASSTKSTKSVAETDRLINEIFHFGSILKAASRHAMGYLRPSNGYKSDSSVASDHPAVGYLPPRTTKRKRLSSAEIRALMLANFEETQSSPTKSDTSSASNRSRSQRRR
jgi:hypothetical protein